MDKETLVNIYYKLKSIDNLSNNLQTLDKKQIADELYKIHQNIQEPIEYIGQQLKYITDAEIEYEKFLKSPTAQYIYADLKKYVSDMLTVDNSQKSEK